jgi:flagellar hook assembly protein FlgD
MNRHRLGTRAAQAFHGAALLSLLLPIRLCAQGQIQLSIDQSFVVPGNGTFCYYNAADKHFYCMNQKSLCGANGTGYCQYINSLDGSGLEPGNGNISNDPHIEFDNPYALPAYSAQSAPYGLNECANPQIPPGDSRNNICNSEVFLCAGIGYSNPGSDPVNLDDVEIEIFKFSNGGNPLDASSTPPLRTFYLDNPGILNPYTYSTNLAASASGEPSNCDPTLGCIPLGPYCVLWDGSYPIQGKMGKTNGQFGFRVTVQTNETSATAGNITITAQRAYPAGPTRDSYGNYVLQQPITVDVTDVHAVVSSPTVVGLSAVYAEPYNLIYRLSKDASMTITIDDPVSGNVLRTVVPGLPRSGEGPPSGNSPSGSLSNGDAWNGRANNGDLLPSGVFLATMQAFAQTQYGPDLSLPTTVQISINPLQITDLRVGALSGAATNLATIGYQLTEPATVYIDIYPPNTQFCADLNAVTADQDLPVVGGPSKNFLPYLGSCGGTPAPLVRHLEQFQLGRVPRFSPWDGTDNNGNEVCTDGDYVFIIYAALPSQNGAPFNGNLQDRRIWTTSAQTGFVPVARGSVGLSQVAVSPTVIGSSPAISGLNPFAFRYSLGRDAITSMNIFESDGTTPVKTLTTNAVRPGLAGSSGSFANQETWTDGTGDNGLWVSSGVYIVRLTAADPLCPMKVSTVSASFPVNLFRVTNVATQPLLGVNGSSATASLSYELSQTMNIVWNIYPPGAAIRNTATAWPPCGMQMTACSNIVNTNNQPIAPIISFFGTRPGRMTVTEAWDGLDINGLMVPDGSYVFTLVAQSTTTPQYYAADQIFGNLVVARGSVIFTSFSVQPFVPPLFNSSATITLDPFTISYALTRQSSVTIQVLNSNVPNQVVRTIFAGQVRDGGVLTEDLWDGRDDHFNIPPAGFYLVRAVAQDVAADLSQPSTAQMTISYYPLRVYDVAIAPLAKGSEGARILYQVSESMEVATKVFRPGTTFDAALNPYPDESKSLVKRFVGLRPARTQITDTWDGTDMNLGVAPDGNYVFTIVASTDQRAIDNTTGKVNPNCAGELALDQIEDNVAVVRNQSANPQGDFVGSTYIFPDPVAGDSANFVIFSPFQADVKLRIYTMSGELVLSKDFPQQTANAYVNGGSTAAGIPCFTWNRSNAAGRRVARGVYYAVIREETTDGSANVLQTVKKFLVL